MNPSRLSRNNWLVTTNERRHRRANAMPSNEVVAASQFKRLAYQCIGELTTINSTENDRGDVASRNFSEWVSARRWRLPCIRYPRPNT
jgi:hypothetical protein